MDPSFGETDEQPLVDPTAGSIPGPTQAAVSQNSRHRDHADRATGGNAPPRLPCSLGFFDGMIGGNDTPAGIPEVTTTPGSNWGPVGCQLEGFIDPSLVLRSKEDGYGLELVEGQDPRGLTPLWGPEASTSDTSPGQPSKVTTR
jgi:hypothetical protein